MNKPTLLSRRLFIRIFIIFILICLTVYIYIQAFPLYYNKVNNTRWWLVNKTLEKKYDISDTTVNILFMGDSRINAGLDFRQIANSWSFGMGGSTPIENYYLLKKYLAVYPQPDTIYFSISPRLYTELYAFWSLAVRNDFFNYSELSEIVQNSRELNDTLFDNSDLLKYCLYKINYPLYYQSDIRDNLVVFARSKNLELIDFVMNNRGKRPHPNMKDSCSEMNYESTMKNFRTSAVIDLYFDKILDLCRSKNIKLIFLSMPMNKTSFEALTATFMRDFEQYMQLKQSKYPEFDFEYQLFSYPDAFFGDESHLNSKGTAKYTLFFRTNQH